MVLDGDDRLRGARRIRGRDARTWRVGGHDRGAGAGREGAAGVGGGTGREVAGGVGEGRAECDERERGCGEELGGGDGEFLVVRSRRWDGRFDGLWERRRSTPGGQVIQHDSRVAAGRHILSGFRRLDAARSYARVEL